jgi:ATP-dependent 26S proteasome regulatory subunit
VGPHLSEERRTENVSRILKGAFSAAARLAPSILFIDEVRCPP